MTRLADRTYVLSRDGTVLSGPYSTQEAAEVNAEREHRAFGRFAFVGTLDAWNQWNSRWSVTGSMRRGSRDRH